MTIPTGAEITLSEEARAFREKVENPSAFPSTCDGGDFGSPESPSIWLMGLEPGWSKRDDLNSRQGVDPVNEEFLSYSLRLQLTWPFNRNSFKLLAALKGCSPDQYRKFAEKYQPFVRGSTGYFKGNLFPSPCNNLTTWDMGNQLHTGFEEKEEYRRWLRSTRFPIFASWVEKCRPKIIIGSGIGGLQDFMSVVGATKRPDQFVFKAGAYDKRIFIANDGAVPLVVIPHLSGGSNGLNSNEAIAKAANHIQAVLLDIVF